MERNETPRAPGQHRSNTQRNLKRLNGIHKVSPGLGTHGREHDSTQLRDNQKTSPGLSGTPDSRDRSDSTGPKEPKRPNISADDSPTGHYQDKEN